MLQTLTFHGFRFISSTGNGRHIALWDTHSENLHTVHSIHTAERVAVCKYAILNEAKTNVILQPLPLGGSVTHLNEHKVIFNHKISSASLHSSPCIITVPYIAKEGS